MHNAGLAELAKRDERFAKWRYFRFDVPSEILGEALPVLHRAGFEGINLTIPHKVRALALVCDADEASRRMGAVNTLVRGKEGYKGCNTDGFGLVQALRVDLETGVRDESVILLGAGGAARAAAVQCLNSGCRDLWIGNRSSERLADLMRELGAEGKNGNVRTFPLDALPNELPRSGILVNATAAGMRSDDPPIIDLSRFDPGLRVFDMIYSPPETKLIREARAFGMRASNGLSMLLWQGVRSLEIWSGEKVPVAAMRRGLAESMGRRRQYDSVGGGDAS
jgi:shikimate dehydrogenase